MSERSFSILAVCGLLMAAVPVAAHHALVAQYDMDKPIEITGTLNKMEFINPHSMLHLDVKNPNGTVTTWVFQTTNAGSLRSRGLADLAGTGRHLHGQGLRRAKWQPDGLPSRPRLPGQEGDDLLVRRPERLRGR
jgi:hypothetical protein